MLQVPRPRAATSPPGPDSSTLERIADWQEKTLRGNLALEALSYGEARWLYEDALAVADDLLEQAVLGNRDAGRCGLLLFGVSCNNVAELARQQRDVETEGIFSYRAVERFITVARSARAPLRFRSRCLLHLKVASEALYRYFEGRGMWDAAASYSERANAAMFEVRRLEVAARQRFPLARGSGRSSLPDGYVPARKVRIDVVGSSPREASPPGPDEGEHDAVLRILEPESAEDFTEPPESHSAPSSSMAPDRRWR